MSSLFPPRPRIRAVNGTYVITPRDVEVAARHHLAAVEAEQELREESGRKFDPYLPWLAQPDVCLRWSELMIERRTSARALIRVIGWRPYWWIVDGYRLRHVYNVRRDHIEIRPLSLPPLESQT